MKKVILSFSVLALMTSCSGTKEGSSTKEASTKSGLGNVAAKQLLSTLTSESGIGDIKKLFGLLDLNKDDSISKKEAVGDVSTNFDAMDKDKNGGLNLGELSGLLGMLK